MATRRRFLAFVARIWWGIALAVIGIALLVLGVVAWIGSERALNPAIGESSWSPDDFPSLAFEAMTFASDTGVTLEGRFFPADGNATVIVLHGFTTRQDQLLPQMAMLHDAGFNVLTYNARHPDYGDGVFATMGVLERHDLVAAVDYLVNERNDVDPDRIGVYGISLGGATAILGAELDPRIKAVVAEAAFSDAERLINTSFERYIGLPSFPFGPVTRIVAEWRAGARLADAEPVDAIARITDRPVLLIHGLADEAVPPDHTERNLESGGDNIEVWWIPGAGHSDGHLVGGEEYRERLVGFFSRTLAPERGRNTMPAGVVLAGIVERDRLFP